MHRWMSRISHSHHSSIKSKHFKCFISSGPCMSLLCCPREYAFSMFFTNPGLCHSALHRTGAWRQLCRNWVTWDAGTLLWRRAPLHTQLRQEVMAALWPPSQLIERAVLLHRQTANASLLCFTSRIIGKAWPWSTMQRKSFTSWGSRTSWRVWSPSWRGLQNSSRL